jgi:hypothetical protein
MKIRLKKSLQQKSELHEKVMATLVEKAECFESNNYRNVSTKELDVLLNKEGGERCDVEGDMCGEHGTSNG